MGTQAAKRCDRYRYNDQIVHERCGLDRIVHVGISIWLKGDFSEVSNFATRWPLCIYQHLPLNRQTL